MEDSLKKTLKNLKENESLISMFLGAAVIAVMVLLIVNYWRQRPTGQITSESTATESGELARGEAEFVNGEIETVDDDLEFLKDELETLVEPTKKKVEKPDEKVAEFSDKAMMGDVVQPTELKVKVAGQKHTVVPGEHLWGIAERYYESGYNWVDIAQANNLNNPGMIVVDQELTIPQAEKKTPSKTTLTLASVDNSTHQISDNKYEVEKGDTLWAIAARAYNDGYSWIKIWEANKDKVSDANIIEVGQTLVIPRG